MIGADVLARALAFVRQRPPAEDAPTPTPQPIPPAPVTAPVPAPVTAPVPAPVTAPVPAPVTAPVPAPVTAPVPAPVGAPVPAPVGAAAVVRTPAQPHALAVQVAAALARRFEGLYLHPYLCPAGIPTIGYGATYYRTGRAVTLKDPAIAREEAEALLLWTVESVYLPAVLLLCPGVSEPHRLAVLIDFSFNLGSARLKTSTLRKKVIAGQWHQVPSELRKWVMSAGKPLRGLVLRREAEIILLPQTQTQTESKS